jgi:hypothetical protein
MMLTAMTRALTSYIFRTLKLILRYPLFSVRVDRNAETWSVRRGDGGTSLIILSEFFAMKLNCLIVGFTAYCGMVIYNR